MLKKLHAKLLQLCPTLCDPMDSSPPGSPIHGILQARILEWVAFFFSSLKVEVDSKEHLVRFPKLIYPPTLLPTFPSSLISSSINIY